MDDNTPVIIGVGQYSERVGEPGYSEMSHMDLGGAALKAAFADAQAAQDLGPALDTLAAIRQFAREWVRQGINVNTIQPGYIQTEIAGDWFQTEGGQRQIAAFHRRRMCPIEALDAPLVFLCSDAARHVTGATLTIDDGQVL